MEESTSTLKIFPLCIFECILIIRSTFKYATSDFTGISKSSSIKKARPRPPSQKLLDLEMPVLLQTIVCGSKRYD